jgi:hypothetical protein
VVGKIYETMGKTWEHIGKSTINEGLMEVKPI